MNIGRRIPYLSRTSNGREKDVSSAWDINVIEQQTAGDDREKNLLNFAMDGSHTYTDESPEYRIFLLQVIFWY